MSPRAAWRLTEVGFSDVYDYVGSKVDWIEAGLPFEGTLADEPRLGPLADADVPTCALEESTEDVAGRLGGSPMALVLNDERVVLGLVRAEALAVLGRRVVDVMQEGPSTYRPNVTAAELAPKLKEHPLPYVVVTTLDGKLVGVAQPEAIQAAAEDRAP